MKLLVPQDKSGVSYWRVWTPLWELQRRNLVEIRTFEARDFEAKEVSEGLKWCDAVYFRGCAGTQGLSLLRQYQSLGKPCIVDQDDFNFDVDPLNPAYERMGTEEVEIDTEEGRKWLWKDGVDGFDLKANRMKAAASLAILQEAAVVITTTPYLKSKFEALAGRPVRVIPNAINFEQWRPMPEAREKYKDGFRLGWLVSNSHASDLMYIRETLKTFLLAHKDAKLVLMGDHGGVNLESYFPADQIEYHTWSNLYDDHYSSVVPTLGLDVAIAPLHHSEFNRCKSPLKFAEYTAFGWPCILEDLDTYNIYGNDNYHFLLAGNPDGWTNALNRLYHDKDLRAKLHFNALHLCKDLFDVKNVALEWNRIFNELLNIEVIQ